jgi:hypothetical protein
MRTLILLGLGLCAAGALSTKQQHQQGVALTPFLAALAMEAGIFLLRRHQGSLLAMKDGNND